MCCLFDNIRCGSGSETSNSAYVHVWERYPPPQAWSHVPVWITSVSLPPPVLFFLKDSFLELPVLFDISFSERTKECADLSRIWSTCNVNRVPVNVPIRERWVCIIHSTYGQRPLLYIKKLTLSLFLPVKTKETLDMASDTLHGNTYDEGPC